MKGFKGEKVVWRLERHGETVLMVTRGSKGLLSYWERHYSEHGFDEPLGPDEVRGEKVIYADKKREVALVK